MWHLQTLGSLRLVDDAGTEVLSGRRKELAVLAFLASRAPRFVPRAVLVELLWSDKDEERGRASLRQALSQLRRALGDALRTRASDDVALEANAVEMDARHLESMAAAGRWGDITALWGGEFLAGADDFGGEAYRGWLDGERGRLSRIAERAFASLVEEGKRRDAWTDVSTVAQRWLDAFPDNADAEAALLRAHEHAPALLPTSVPVDEPVPAERTYRSSRLETRWLGGAVALAVVVATGAVGIRQAWWVGPAGERESHADARQTVVVADFRALGADTALACLAAEAVRIGLRQSHALAVYPDAAVWQALARLGEPVTSRVTLGMGRTIAARAGVKAVLDGELLAAGNRYLLSSRLVATVSGEELAHYATEAADSSELLSAVDRLVKQIRREAGEPLRSIEAARGVERVTSSSLEAFAKYVRGTRALDMEGAQVKGRALLEEAVALDSTFAMAHRRLGIELSERGGNEARVRDLMTRAYNYRMRLTDPERYAVEAAYYSYAAPDEDKAFAAYTAALEADPSYDIPLTNLASIALRHRQWARAESLSRRLIDIQTVTVQGHANLIEAQTYLGKLEAAAATLAHFAATSPRNPGVSRNRATLFYARGLADSAGTTLRNALGLASIDVARRQEMARMLRDLALIRGDVDDARRWSRIRSEAQARSGGVAAPLDAALEEAWLSLRFDHDTIGALRAVDIALRSHPLADIPALDRPYGLLVRIFSWAARPKRARAALAGYDSAIAGRSLWRDRYRLRAYRGEIALAEQRYVDAIADFRAADSTSCVVCMLPWLAAAYDGAGQRDSATAILTRYVTVPSYERLATDALFLSAAKDYLAGSRRSSFASRPNTSSGRAR
jgi:DNA-binding SARP family transcriptional activator